MKLLADEDIDYQIVEKLRKDGYKISYVLEMDPSISDDEVIKLANQEEALLLTADKDFGELVFRQNRILFGVILIRLSGLSPHYKSKIVSNVIKKHQDKLKDNFTVISHGGVRIRRKTFTRPTDS